MDTQFQSVKNSIYKLEKRKQEALFNSLLWRLKKLRPDDLATLATRARDNSVVVVGENHLRCGAGADKKPVNNPGYEQKRQAIWEIINKSPDPVKYTPVAEWAGLLVQVLTVGQINRLNYDGLYEMLKIAGQSYDSSVTNQFAYVLGAYEQVVNNKYRRADYNRTLQEQREEARAWNRAVFGGEQ